MDVLFLGTIILLVATAIFYIIFVSLAYYWHEKKISVVVIPLLYTFDFFIIGFLIVVLLVLVTQYLPGAINTINNANF